MKTSPRKMRLILFILPLFLLGGCENDYDITKKLRDSYKSRVVLNSLISPDEPVTLQLHWSRRYDYESDYIYGSEFEPVPSFTAELYDQGQLVDTYEGTDGKIETKYYPSEGHTYKWIVTVPNYGKVSAETEIPRSAETDIKFIKKKNDFYHFNIEDIKMPDSRRAAWIKAARIYGGGDDDDDEVRGVYDYYSNSPFPDQINAYVDSFETNDAESSVSYEYFIRIPRINIAAACPTIFAFYCSPSISAPIDWDDLEVDDEGNTYLEEKDPIPLIQVQVLVITPSDDYDKYFRAVYKQDIFNYEAEIPFFSESVHIHCNVENGLGIFAGHTVSKHIHIIE